MNIRYFCAVLLSVFSFTCFSQIVYSENFGTGCSTGTTATSFGWTNTNTGANQATPNIWYVSAAERGMGAGVCGAGCGGTNSRTLHLGTGPLAYGDLGASYLESSAFICAILGLCSGTDKRIESPVINCTGVSSIPFTFEYIENGEGTNDNGTVWYSANGGGTWSLLDDSPKTTICGSGQGLWTARNLTLPASANNNPNVKIGFRWVNNANGVGTDPSFAIDNIVIGTAVLGVTMREMNVICSGDDAVINWSTQTETNSDKFILYRSEDTNNWREIGQIPSNTNSSNVNFYSFTDNDNSSEVSYYYISQFDMDGKETSYEILPRENCKTTEQVIVFPNPTNKEVNISYYSKEINRIQFYSMDGRLVYDFDNQDGTTSVRLIPNLQIGKYIVHIFSSDEIEISKIEIVD